jgi:hypothetical protein
MIHICQDELMMLATIPFVRIGYNWLVAKMKRTKMKSLMCAVALFAGTALAAKPDAGTPDLPPKVGVPELRRAIARDISSLHKAGFECAVTQDRIRNLGFLTCVAPDKKNIFGSLYIFHEGVWELVSADFAAGEPSEI